MNEFTQELVFWAVVGGIVVILAACLLLFRKLGAYIDLKKSTFQEGSLEAKVWATAQEAYAWAEKEGKGLIGSQKADIAYEYGVRMLNNFGINVSADKLKASINKAWIILERVPRETSTVSPEQVQRTIKKEFEATLKNRT